MDGSEVARNFRRLFFQGLCLVVFLWATLPASPAATQET